MGSAASELDSLREATDRVVSEVLSDLVAASAPFPPAGSGARAGAGSGSGAGAVQLVIVGPGRPGEFKAAGPVSFASFGRDVVVPALVGHDSGDCELPTPIMVARYLAGRDIDGHPDHAELWSEARWMTTSGGDATALGEQLRADGGRVGLILVADGAACHGPKAPRAEDLRAQAYDERVCAALASGQPGQLAQIEVSLGEELGATGPQVWPVLVNATRTEATAAALDTVVEAMAAGAAGAAGADGWRWTGELVWAGAPYGVGWAVARWRRS